MAGRGRKPKVLTRCVANTYTIDGERIVEFSGRNDEEGGLIAFRYTDEGMVISLYALGNKVKILTSESSRGSN